MNAEIRAARARVTAAAAATRYAASPDEELAALECQAAAEAYLNGLFRAAKLAAGEPVQRLEGRRWLWQTQRRRPRARPAAGPSGSGSLRSVTPMGTTPARPA